jgi:hypothetical protein
MKLKCFLLSFGILVLIHGLTAAVAQTWTQASATTNYYWWSVAMSADGCKLAAVGSTDHPIFSTDAGATWHTNQSSPHAWNSIASSADGTKLVAPMVISNNYASIGIFVSTNSGGTWTQTTAPLSSWQYVTSSGAGDKLGAIMSNANSLGSIYVSTNSGLSWSKIGSPLKYWTSLACSADGTKFIATASGDKIYVSTNFGTTWTATTSPNAKWISVACNADGTRLIASGSGTYTSTNSGGSWRLASTNTGAVASSADGTKLIIAGNSTFTSNDSGVTWISNSAPYSLNCVASSADGSEWMVGAEYQTGIWIGRTVPSPQLNLGLVSSNLVLSWLVPSTNFALQQTADLKTPNWVPLTNAPSLNPVNLQEQVTLSPANGGGFFRLITQ